MKFFGLLKRKSTKRYMSKKELGKQQTSKYKSFAKSFLLLGQGYTGVDFPVKLFLAGSMDDNYKELFHRDKGTFITSKLDDCIYKSREYVTGGSKNYYMVALGYPVEQVKILAKKGLLSRAVVEVYSCNDLSRFRQKLSKDASFLSKVSSVVNERFDSNLMSDDDKSEKPSFRS